MSTILITGGTGQLGRPTVAELAALGHDVRVLSRSPGENHIVGDLHTGAGLDEALDGVDTVVYLASSIRTDTPDVARFLAAARAVRHIVYISIVGVDRIPLGYYRQKLASEKLIAESGVPFTILRATQFHSFAGNIFAAQRRLPVLFSLAIPMQPIAVGDVAARLAQLADAEPAGRVPDIGGPELTTVSNLAETWQAAFGTRKKIWTLRLPGRTFAAYRKGHHTTTLPGYGQGTFAEFAADRASDVTE